MLHHSTSIGLCYKHHYSYHNNPIHFTLASQRQNPLHNLLVYYLFIYLTQVYNDKVILKTDSWSDLLKPMQQHQCLINLLSYDCHISCYKNICFTMNKILNLMRLYENFILYPHLLQLNVLVHVLNAAHWIYSKHFQFFYISLKKKLTEDFLDFASFVMK